MKKFTVLFKARKGTGTFTRSFTVIKDYPTKVGNRVNWIHARSSNNCRNEEREPREGWRDRESGKTNR